MDAEFWHHKWANNEIAFHQGEANPLLVNHFDALSLPKGSRVFLPLCGKTLDIAWLLAHGYRVVGAELSALAIDQLFAGLGVAPAVSAQGKVTRHSATGIEVYVGDIFDVSRSLLGHIDAVYDRAALVALPEAMRARYAAHLMDIAGEAPQLLISYEYDQSVMDGPPFSVSNQEITRHYGDRYHMRLLASTDVPGGLKGKCAATENVWLLQKPNNPNNSN